MSTNPAIDSLYLDEPDPENSKFTSKELFILRGLLALFFISVIIVLYVIVSGKSGDILGAVQDWGSSASWRMPLALFALNLAATILIIPGRALVKIAAGFFLGIIYGTLLMWISSLIGCIVSFLIGRYLFREFIRKIIKKTTDKRIRAALVAAGEEGWKIVLLFRLNIIVPENLTNYGLSVTKLLFMPYFLATIPGVVPLIFIKVYLGSGAASLVDFASVDNWNNQTSLEIALYIVGAVFILISIIIISRKSNQLLKRANAQREMSDEELHSNIDSPSNQS